jgi:hypothetical protein
MAAANSSSILCRGPDWAVSGPSADYWTGWLSPIQSVQSGHHAHGRAGFESLRKAGANFPRIGLIDIVHAQIQLAGQTFV